MSYIYIFFFYIYILFFFLDKAAGPSKVECNVVVRLAAELKRSAHFPSESSPCHFPVIQGSRDHLEPQRLRVWIILYRWARHLAGCGKYYSTHLGARIYFHGRANYLSDRLGSGEKKWWVIAFLKGI